MKIVLVNDKSWTTPDSVGTSTKLLASQLTSLGHNVILIGPNFSTATNGELGVPSVLLPGSSGYSFGFPELSDIEETVEDADVVHVHYPLSLGRFVSKVAHRYNVPVVFTNHSNYLKYAHCIPIGGILTKSFESYLNDFAKTCSILIAPTPMVQSNFEQANLGVPTSYVPNGIETKKFIDVDGIRGRKNLAIDLDEKVILCLNNSPSESSLFVLRRLLSGLKPTPRLIVFGNQFAWQQLKHQLKAIVGDDRIIVTDPKNDREYLNFYAASDIAISLSDSSTNRVIEAMASGIPLVASRSSSASGVIINNKTGFVTGNSGSELTMRALSLINQPALRYAFAQNSIQEVQKYDIANTAKQILGVYGLARKLVHAV